MGCVNYCPRTEGWLATHPQEEPGTGYLGAGLAVTLLSFMLSEGSSWEQMTQQQISACVACVPLGM